MLGFAPVAASPLASSGISTLSAILAATEAKDAIVINANINSTASLAVTEAPDVVAFNVVAGNIVGYLAATEAQDSAAFAGIVSTGMVLAATEAADTVAINIGIVAGAYLYASEALDTAALTVNNQNIYFNLTEAPDIAAFNIAMTGTMAMAVTETPDSYTQNAYILWLTPTQPDDPTIWVPKNDPAPYLTTVI